MPRADRMCFERFARLSSLKYLQFALRINIKIHQAKQLCRCSAQGVQRLSATGSAFAALKSDGRVVAWGNPAAGGVFFLWISE